jgi:hypothetical protein
MKEEKPMIIDNFTSEKRGNRARVSATVSWEDSDRPAQELFFETEEDYAEGLRCNPNAFLIAPALASMHQGEKRVRINGEICPQLKDGLMTAMGWLRHWYDHYKYAQPVIIEAKTQKLSPYQEIPRRSAVFFSGGIDALATVRWNRLNYPAEHPLSFKDGILVYGLEIEKIEAFEYLRSSLKELAEEAGLTLIPVYTNIRSLNEDWIFWVDEFEGAVFSSIAHALVGRLKAVSLSSTYNIPFVHPHSSHPLLDPNYSSADLQFRHELIALSRFEKTNLVAGWTTALQKMRVCNQFNEYRPGMFNCGKCGKCVYTMLALLSLGMLDKAGAFPINDLTEELVDSVPPGKDNTYPFYYELLPKMVEIKRPDLARAVERKIKLYHQTERRKRLRKSYIEPLVEYDARNLGGTLHRLKRLTHTKGIWTSPR